MNKNMYTISQVLGSHYPTGGKLSDLHNLLYTSKHAYQGSLYRYSQEECQLPISKQEFMNYFKIKPQHKITIFISDFQLKFYSVKMQSVLITSYGSDSYGIIKYSTLYAGSLYPYQTHDIALHGWDKTHYRLNELWDVLFNKLTLERINNVLVSLDPFTHPDYTITFDVVTMYEILTKRGSCVQLIKNYAKNIVLSTFDEYVNVLSRDNAIPLLNVYLYNNAEVFGIAKDYQPLIQKYASYLSDLQTYIANTQSLRDELIKIIREAIINMN